MDDVKPRKPRRANQRLLVKLLVVVGAMFGFGYALVPMYNAICEALGINVLTLSEQRVATGAVRGRHRCGRRARRGGRV